MTVQFGGGVKRPPTRRTLERCQAQPLFVDVDVWTGSNLLSLSNRFPLSLVCTVHLCMLVLLGCNGGSGSGVNVY